MRKLGWIAATLVSIACFHRAPVAAEQIVVTDVSYTHSADTTTDSHYRVTPSAATPADWTSPTDFTQGSVYVALDVKTKPAGDTPTKFQICFEATPSYACTDQSPTYTTTGHYTWTTPFSRFYYGGDVDWSMGVQTVALILKDTMNNKPAGDPKYMPTDLHVEVVLLSKDATYVAPSGDAGAGGRAGASGSAGAAVSGGHGGGAGHAAGRGGAGTSAHGGAGGVERAGSGGHAGAIASAADGGDDEDAGLDAGTVVADAGAAGQVGAGSANDAGSPTTHRSKGCSAVASREQPQHLGAIAVAFGWLAFARRRRISERCAPARADRR